MALVLDAGGLIAVDRRDRRIGAVLRAAQVARVRVTTSAAVVAQVWRDGARQASLARTLAGLHIVAFDQVAARRVGELLGASNTSDVVGAHLALLVEEADVVATSDEGDIRRLLDARRVSATIEAC